jgi:hypothetical protein
MQWLTRAGPFWEDEREHREDDYLECHGVVVTDTAVGEAGYCCACTLERHLVSFSPSRWQYTPVRVSWFVSDSECRDVEVVNHWKADAVEAVLVAAPPGISSWGDLELAVRHRFPNLTISDNAFEKLGAQPFVMGAAERILCLLGVLSRLKQEFDGAGNRTAEGHRLYNDHFAGEKSWFSDSSTTEKTKFANELTFRKPGSRKEYLCCPWHGKVKSPQLRIHFSWPITVNEPLYVVYVGPKLTKG